MLLQQLTCTLHTVLNVRNKAAEPMRYVLAHTEGPQKVNVLYITGTRTHTVLKHQPCCVTTKPFDQVIYGTYSSIPAPVALQTAPLPG